MTLIKDFNKYEKNEYLQNEVEDCEVKIVYLRESETETGIKKIRVFMDIMSGEYEGKSFSQSYLLNEKGSWIFGQLLMCCGICSETKNSDGQLIKRPPDEFDTDLLIGKSLLISTKIKEYEHKSYLNIYQHKSIVDLLKVEEKNNFFETARPTKEIEIN